MLKQKKKILIVGSSTKAAVYVTKQLNEYGLDVTMVDWNDTPVRFSKYIDNFILLSSPLRNADIFYTEFLNVLSENKFDCLIPIHDPAVELCTAFRTEINNYCQILGLNNDYIQSYASDKSKLYKLAKEIGMTIPKSRLVSNLQQLDSILDDISFPCVIKPIRSAILKDNHIYQFKVTIANDKSTLIDAVRENINNVDLLLQEYINGYGIGYNIFAKNGEILNAYIHRRLNEKNGISSYRESLRVNEYNLKLPVTELVNKIGWSGVAMIEFKIQEGVPYLMEMNGRFWGSIEVAIKSGLNYPVMLYESQYLNKDVERDLPIKKVQVRNLKDEVIIYSDRLLKQRKIGEFIKWFFSLFRILRKDNFIEDNFFDNPLFVSATYYYEVKRIFRKIILKLKYKFFKIPNRGLNFSKEKKYSIIFVCSGNICRSPFAEKYAQIINKDFHFYSCGTAAYEHRLSPLNAVKAASKFGVDLSLFQSKSVDHLNPENVDCIIIFDKKNYFDLKSLGVNTKKIHFLSPKEINDPYGKAEEIFDNQYNLIKKRIDQLFSINN